MNTVAAGRKQMVPTQHDLPEEKRAAVVTLLNQQLADTFDLYSQTKQAHWNLKGMHFIALHELFDTVGSPLIAEVDTIAERATSLGGIALGTTRMAAAASRLPEFPDGPVQCEEAVELLVERYAAVAKSTREAITESAELGDDDTADIFTALSRHLDQALWFLEAHIQR